MSSLSRIAFLTCDSMEGFTSDDDRVIQKAREEEIFIDSVSWRAQLDWSRYTHVVIRTTWDYTRHLHDFLSALKNIQAAGCKLFNSLETVVWNSNKKYLLELEGLGVAVLPTRVVDGATPKESLLEAARSWRIEKVVVKPTVGASSDGLSLLTLPELEARSFTEGEWLLQPFVEEIRGGEVSFQFFNREFSHGTLKVPQAGDIRVQEEHGSVISPRKCSQEEIRAAAAVLEAVPGELLYARVDMVPFRGKLHLMELELIEPALYLRTDPQSPERFLKALQKHL